MLGGAVNNLARTGAKTANSVFNSFTPKAWKEAAAASREAFEVTAPSSKLATYLAAPFKGLLKLGFLIVEAPVTWLVVKPVTAIVGGIGTLYSKAPRPMSVATAGLAILGIGSWITNRRSEAKMAQYAAAQDAAVQAAAMQEAMAAQAPMSYKNSVSPELSAQLAARQAAGKDGAGANHAAAVTAARDAAAAQPATPPVTSVA